MSTPPDSRARREELKRAYRERPPAAGVFAVRCLATGRVLLGASRNPQGSLNGIRFQLEQRVYRTHPALQADFTRLGAAQFSFEVLDLLEPKEGEDPDEALAALEALWREKLGALPGYGAPSRSGGQAGEASLDVD